MYFEKLWTEFSKLQEVEAIVLGGSRAMDNFDEKSDYDLYIYCSEIPAINIREQILTSTCDYMELGNHFWELEDDCTLKDGVDIDILYRNLDIFTQEVCLCKYMNLPKTILKQSLCSAKSCQLCALSISQMNWILKNQVSASQ